jgi:methionyl-tRNA synthetase
MKEKYLVTPALPYANGALHLGHLLEHIMVNVFVRALKMAQKDVLYVCGADSHGTAIEISAQKANKSPQDLAAYWQIEHEKTLKNFLIEFDNGYGSTHTEENQIHAEKIYAALKNQNHISQREIEQLFDPELKRFLPDRMVKGTCPKCQAPDQYGDNCEACGKTYSPTELINPKSALSNATPKLKKSSHLFVNLNNFGNNLESWLTTKKVVNPDIFAYLQNWFKEGLKEWDISRDGPYFGFAIPGEENKFFYVWLDAPIGYISLTDLAARNIGRTYEDYWKNKDTKIIHFIGKDIVYFHTLFWPSMLMATDYTLPSQIVVHGMLTVNGEKMSKSRGTFILADLFAKHLDPESLRYYFACKLNNSIEDIDLNFSDFVSRVNTDLVNKVVNIISRALPLLHKFFDAQPSSSFDSNASELISEAKNVIKQVEKHYLAYDSSKAINCIVRLSEQANKYLQDNQPWKLMESDKQKAHEIISTGLFIGKVCFGLLKPVLPKAVSNLERLVNNNKEFTFENLSNWFENNQKLLPYEHLFSRIEEHKTKDLINDNQPQATPMTKENYISIDQFMAIELRAAKILEVKEVEGSDKLLAFKLDLGELGERNILAGLKLSLDITNIVGKTLVIVANLEPRKMRFGTSEGMILACGAPNHQPIFLNNVQAGEIIR